VNTATHTEDFA